MSSTTASHLLKTSAIVRDLRRALRVHLRDALDAVEAAYAEQAQQEADVELLALPSPVTIAKGFDDQAYKRPLRDFPRISILGVSRQAGEARSNLPYADALHLVLIETLIAAPTPDEAAELNWRFTEAILLVVCEHEPFGGCSLDTNIAPDVGEGLTSAVGTKPNTVDKPLGYVAGSTITLALNGTYTR